MKNGFRQSMAWLHTWSGLLFGWLLFAIFLTGTVAYFRHEVTLWMQPELHGSVVPVDPAAPAALALRRLAELGPGAESWSVSLPDARGNTIGVSWRDAGERGRNAGERRVLDATTGEVLDPRETAGGNFLYRFHFELYGMPRDWARRIVGIATMAMFVAIVSGVITHKKIFKDFFTFRTGKGQRSWLDMHNMTAVLALPFHVMITYSGLILFTSTLLPFASDNIRRGPPPQRENPAIAAPVAAPQAPRLATITPILAQAEEHWQRRVTRVSVEKLHSPRPEIVLSPSGSSGITARASGGGGSGGRESMRFDAKTGALIEMTETGGVSAVGAINNAFGTLHRARFADTPLRWLFFLAGIAGTAMVGTGLFLWVSKRAVKHAKAGAWPPGFRLVERLNVGGVAGLSLATGAYFWGNRLLPARAPDRAEQEITVFFLAWLLTALHPFLRGPARAWPEQLAAAAFLFLGLPVLNAATGGTGLAITLPRGDWLLAGMDLAALATGLALASAAWMTRPSRPTSPTPPRRARAGTAPIPGE